MLIRTSVRARFALAHKLKHEVTPSCRSYAILNAQLLSLSYFLLHYLYFLYSLCTILLHCALLIPIPSYTSPNFPPVFYYYFDLSFTFTSLILYSYILSHIQFSWCSRRIFLYAFFNIVLIFLQYAALLKPANSCLFGYVLKISVLSEAKKYCSV